MGKCIKKEQRSPVQTDTRSVLEEVLREGARKMLTDAVITEVEEFIDNHRHVRDDNGRQVVVYQCSAPMARMSSGHRPTDADKNTVVRKQDLTLFDNACMMLRNTIQSRLG